MIRRKVGESDEDLISRIREANKQRPDETDDEYAARRNDKFEEGADLDQALRSGRGI